ncbi:RNase H domain-containing protein [Trichonephila clavipes]|nr:RNase H domain-containing protein [Trichonephila clavipes]
MLLPLWNPTQAIFLDPTHPAMFQYIRETNRVLTHRVISANGKQDSHPTSVVFPPTSDAFEAAPLTTPCHILPTNQESHIHKDPSTSGRIQIIRYGREERFVPVFQFKRNPDGQGHPRARTSREDRHLSIVARRNKDATSSPLTCELYAATGTRISWLTVSRRLHEKRLFARRHVVCVPSVLQTGELVKNGVEIIEIGAWIKKGTVLFINESRFSLTKVIDGIPLDAAKIYTDGSKGETNTAGSGVLIELPGRVIKFQRRNADHASVFRTELTAIMSSLSFIKNIRDLAFSEIWILTDNRSSIQHLSNWPSIGDSTSRSILHLFQQLSDRHPIHLQWFLSHVGLFGNEVADDLAKAATSNPVDPEDHMFLTSTEIYSRAKELICRT